MRANVHAQNGKLKEVHTWHLAGALLLSPSRLTINVDPPHTAPVRPWRIEKLLKGLVRYALLQLDLARICVGVCAQIRRGHKLHTSLLISE